MPYLNAYLDRPNLMICIRDTHIMLFLLCYALIPNTKPITLIVLYLLCSLNLQYLQTKYVTIC